MDATTPPPVAAPAAVAEDKTVAIVSYLTLVGWIVALLIHSNKKTRLGAFHLRQALGIYLSFVLAGVANWVLLLVPFIGWLAIPVLWLGLVVLWVIGLIAAVNGQLKPVPLLGEHYQKFLGTAFD
jgi:uncharacterized membrane protein